MGEVPARVVRFGVFEFEAESGTLWKSGRRIKLQDQPRQVLRMLVERPGELVTREELRRALWPEDTFVDFDTGLNVVINKLRQALDDSAGSPRFIETFPRRGYRFVAPVFVAGADDAGPIADDVTLRVTSVAPGSSRRRLGFAAWFATAAVIALLSLAGYSLRGGSKQEERPFDTIKPQRLTGTGSATRAAVSRDGRYVAYGVIDSNRRSLRVQQSTASASVEIVPPAPGTLGGVTISPDGHFVYYSFSSLNENRRPLYRVPVLGGSSQKLTSESVNSAVTFSPDGRRMAFGRLEADMLTTTLWVSDAEGNRPTRLAELKHPHGFVLNDTRLDWSPDGKVILAPVLEEPPRRQIGFIDVATGRIELSKHRWSDLGGVAWLRDGSGFLVAGRPDDLPGRSSQIWRVDYPAGTLRQVTNDVREYLDVHVAEGLFVASSFEEMSTLWIASAENLPHATELETDGESWAEGAYGVAWAPDGRLIYTSLARGENDLWELEVRSGVRRQLTSEASYDGLPAVSPDGRAIAFVSNRDGPVRVWVMDRDGGRARPLTTGPFDMFPAWGHDGSYLLFSKPRTGAVAQIVTFPEGRERPLTTATDDEPGANTFRGYAVSRDGLIAGYVVDGSWRLAVASRDGRPPRLLDARWGSASPLAWSPDGLAIHVVNPSDQFNLWSYPVDGGTPTRLTNFATPRIRFFAWSPDGKWLALSHGQDRLDVMVFADQSRR